MLLDPELTALVGESYHRAYRIMIQVQQLAELEEIILHKAAPLSMPLDLLVRMWRGRLAQAQTLTLTPTLTLAPTLTLTLTLNPNPNPNPQPYA